MTEVPQVFVTVTILVILLDSHRLVLTDLSQALRTVNMSTKHFPSLAQGYSYLISPQWNSSAPMTDHF